MNTNTMRCIDVNEKNVVKEIKLGSTTIKFCSNCIANTKEERESRMKVFKQNIIRLLSKTSDTNEGG